MEILLLLATTSTQPKIKSSYYREDKIDIGAIVADISWMSQLTKRGLKSTFLSKLQDVVRSAGPASGRVLVVVSGEYPSTQWFDYRFSSTIY